MKPQLSVVIPTLDRWDLVQRAAISAGGISEDAGTEIVIVDDASKSTAPASLEGMPNVRIARHELRQGVAKARNTGIARAEGKWIGFLDDDDIWAPGRAKAMLAALNENDADFAYSGAIVVDESLRPLLKYSAPSVGALPEALIRGNAIPGGGSGVVARNSLLRQLGGFDEGLSFAADWDMWIRLAEVGKPAVVHDLLVAYVYGSHSWVLSGDHAIEAEFDRVAIKHRALAERLSVSVDRRSFDLYKASSLMFAGRKADGVRAFASVARRHRYPKALLQGLMLFSSRVVFSRYWPWVTDPAWLDLYRPSR